MEKLALLLLAFTVVFQISGQLPVSSGVRQNGLANTTVTLTDVWAVRNNPGAFAFMKASQASLTYQNRFIVSELSTQNLAYGHHMKNGNIGVYLQHTGFNLFRSIQTGATYSLALSPRLGMGISGNYQQTRFGDIYGVKHHFTANLGVMYILNKAISVGASILNINRSKISDFENERLPTVFTIGAQYNISKKVLWLIDVEKEIASAVNIKSALELEAHENFDIRMGINTYPFQSAFGFGIHLDNLSIDMAAIWHSTIGLTPSLGIIYSFK
ncbi:MAG: hypothetical protein R3279_04305 [Putridiphycobacter sp.]|nr:hypothetical protein [Putridiphycobacter sp.]